MAEPGASNDPLVTVVIPALNAAQTIARQLDAVLSQRPGFDVEVIVSDNGSTDGTRAIAAERPGVRVVDASARRGAGAARNNGAAAARGKYLLFCDADDEVTANWVRHMVDALQRADLAGGAFEQEALESGAPDTWRSQTSDRLPGSLFLPAATSGNLGISRDVFAALDGFDLRFDGIGGEDLDLCWRAQHAGYTIAFAPGALVRLRFRAGTRSLARQAFTYGEGVPLLYSVHREHGMARRKLSRTVRQAVWVLVHAPDAFRGESRRRAWIWGTCNLLGRVAGSIRFRVLYV